MEITFTINWHINIDPKLKIMDKKASKQFLKIKRYVLPKEINDKTHNKIYQANIYTEWTQIN